MAFSAIILTIGAAFLTTVALTVLTIVSATLLGVLLTIASILPVSPLQKTAAVYIQVVRNTPLTIVFFLVVFGLPQVGFVLPFFPFAWLALTLYTATFVAETLRSGVLSVAVGEVEAARALGLSWHQLLASLILPQAARSIVPPMTSNYIALLKNTSIASAFGVLEATGVMVEMVNQNSSYVIQIMILTAGIYLALSLGMGLLGDLIERKVRLTR
ncbi:amino acid ABC transporter permease [Castellaniella sp.]|uniref:amino acid ABC transporter permease n=1 Tax=Castellaniella sp. TaxID=1955812 RepID=UPI00355E4DDC